MFQQCCSDVRGRLSFSIRCCIGEKWFRVVFYRAGMKVRKITVIFNSILRR